MEMRDGSEGLPEQGVNPETKLDRRKLAVATITFFPGWYPGEVTEERDLTSKTRGDIGLQTLKEAKEKGYQVLVVDGGSSNEFKNELTRLGITVQDQEEKGYSAGRQQSYREASKLEGVKAILSTEAEKFSVIHDCISDEAIKLILEGKYDAVLLKRTKDSFATYPPEQAEYEQRANELFNSILRARNLLPENEENLDAWFGPRLIKNDPAVLDLFLQNYTFLKTEEKKIDEITDPSVWANALFLPIVNALKNGLKVGSFTVPYQHPSDQTSMEKGDPAFDRKRDIQYKSILRSIIHLIRMIDNSPKTKLRRV